MHCRILKQGPNLFESLTIGGREIARNGRLLAILEDRSEYVLEVWACPSLCRCEKRCRTVTSALAAMWECGPSPPKPLTAPDPVDRQRIHHREARQRAEFLAACHRWQTRARPGVPRRRRRRSRRSRQEVLAEVPCVARNSGSPDRLGRDWVFGGDEKHWFGGYNQNLATDYLHEGATGSSGNVYEPNLAGCARPDYLLPAWFQGRNLADSYYLSLPFLSWQGIVLGDPLCSLGKP